MTGLQCPSCGRPTGILKPGFGPESFVGSCAGCVARRFLLVRLALANADAARDAFEIAEARKAQRLRAALQRLDARGIGSAA